jgi:hypothetical protein
MVDVGEDDQRLRLDVAPETDEAWVPLDRVAASATVLTCGPISSTGYRPIRSWRSRPL